MEDGEPLDAPNEPLRIPCPGCHQQTLERVFQIPMPPIYELMRLVLWPEQQKHPKKASERQTVLPGLSTWLPGGEAFRTSLYAQLPSATTSGFT